MKTCAPECGKPCIHLGNAWCTHTKNDPIWWGTQRCRDAGRCATKPKKTPVDVPYIVTLRKQSRFAQRFGAKAWYEYPKLAHRVGEKALALRDFVGLLLEDQAAARAVPLSLYRKVFSTAIEHQDEDNT